MIPNQDKQILRIPTEARNEIEKELIGKLCWNMHWGGDHGLVARIKAYLEEKENELVLVHWEQCPGHFVDPYSFEKADDAQKRQAIQGKVEYGFRLLAYFSAKSLNTKDVF
ncbi:MAG: hypothetical protein KAT43_03275 [Nanoarchaeota archaeon]|nr:hypothetical protein [Nanoarchaeota archaeon]